MTSNSPHRYDNQYQRPTYRKSSSDFITSPIDHHRRNALQDRELRHYLKYSENFNKLVKAGILLSDGRVVCSDEQWRQTREFIIKKIQASIYERSKSASPDTKLRRSRTSATAVSTNSDTSPSPRPGTRTGRSSSHHLPGNVYDTASKSSDELWGNMSNNATPGTSKETGTSRRGSAYSRDGSSRRHSQSTHQASGKPVSGKTQSSSGIKNDRGSPQPKKSLREQDSINKQRILDELRKNAKSKVGNDKQHQSKEHVAAKEHGSEENRRQRNADQAEVNVKQDTTNRASQRESVVFRTLEQARDILMAMKDGVGETALRAMTQAATSGNVAQDADTDPLDALFLELLNRQDRLFRALGERNVEEISSFLELVPMSLLLDHRPTFKQYSPHVRLKKMVDDLLSKSVTEDVFFREAAGLVKLMNPTQIVRHIGMCVASMTAPRRILRVISKSVADDRFGLTWLSERPSRDKVMPLASRLVDDAIEQARTVHNYLTRESDVNLSLLGIGSPDPLAAAPRHVSVGDLTIEPYNDEHVSFSTKSVVLRRPLEDGLAVADLKPVLDRPPTPIPDAERVRGKSRERLERLEAESAIMEAKRKARELVQEIRQDSEKRVRRRMKQHGLKHEEKLFEDVKKTMLTESYSEKLKDQVYTRLADWKETESERNRHLARVVESISDLVPHVVGAQRDRFVRSISRQVSSIVAATLKEAQEIMKEAITATRAEANTEADNLDDDSDEFESVSSAFIGDAKPEDQLGESLDLEQEERDTFKPIFGGDELHLSHNVMASGLAAISVKHREDGHGHEGHSHAPPVSHMKQFFKSRASMPAISALSDSSAAAGRQKRHTMPAALPECMDPSQLHGRHSFLSVTQPDVKTLPEYRHKTQRQVEAVVQEHSVFGRLQQLAGSPPVSDDETELVSEDLGRPDEEIVPKFRRQRQPLPVAEVPLDEERDSVSELPPTDEDERRRESPRPVASSPVTHQSVDPEESSTLSSSAATTKTQSLTPSRMMLRCDSDPRLSLRTSTAEVHVDVHEHSAFCEHHESHDEAAAELQVLESSAFGINAERTASTSRLAGSEAVVTGVRRSGSADGGQLMHSDIDSDDETELRVQHPKKDDVVRTGGPSRYY